MNNYILLFIIRMSNFSLLLNKGGVGVEEDPRHTFVKEGSGHYKLVITQCEDEDSGEYSFNASNKAGMATTSCNVTVEPPESLVDPPVFEKEFGDVSVYEGETVTFEVLVSGDVNCDIDWYKNGGDMDEGPRHKFIDKGNGLFTLLISECEDDDTGEYCCVASNSAGRVTAAGNLFVKGKIKKFLCPSIKSGKERGGGVRSS